MLTNRTNMLIKNSLFLFKKYIQYCDHIEMFIRPYQFIIEKGTTFRVHPHQVKNKIKNKKERRECHLDIHELLELMPGRCL